MHMTKEITATFESAIGIKGDQSPWAKDVIVQKSVASRYDSGYDTMHNIILVRFLLVIYQGLSTGVELNIILS